MHDVTIKVNNIEYGGWKTATISRGIEQIAGTFTLGVSDKWPGQDVSRPIKPGDACTVCVDGEDVITGYVDDATPGFGPNSHELTVSGRDATGDLVDCSAIYGSGEWIKRDIVQIAKDLCDPFGISVAADVDYGVAFNKWSIQESETVFECLERAAKIRGLLHVSDGQGGVLFTRAGSERIATGLIEGENILSGTGAFSWRDRYKTYTVKAQNAGDDNTTTDQNAGPKGEATDPSVTRYRPLIVLAEDLADTAKCTERAVWEAAVRAGKAARATVTVQGWKHKDGLWQPNRLVRLVSSSLNVDQDLLIISTVFYLDEGGTRTELTLCDKKGFELIELPEPTDDEEST